MTALLNSKVQAIQQTIFPADKTLVAQGEVSVNCRHPGSRWGPGLNILDNKGIRYLDLLESVENPNVPGSLIYPSQSPMNLVLVDAEFRMFYARSGCISANPGWVGYVQGSVLLRPIPSPNDRRFINVKFDKKDAFIKEDGNRITKADIVMLMYREGKCICLAMEKF